MRGVRRAQSTRALETYLDAPLTETSCSKNDGLRWRVDAEPYIRGDDPPTITNFEGGAVRIMRVCLNSRLGVRALRVAAGLTGALRTPRR